MKEQLQRYKQYLLTGVSYVIPFIASGGILIALAVAFAPMTSQGPSFSDSPLSGRAENLAVQGEDE